MSHICVWASVYHMLPFFDTNVGCGEAVDLDDPKNKQERKHDKQIAENRNPWRNRRPAKTVSRVGTTMSAKNATKTRDTIIFCDHACSCCGPALSLRSRSGLLYMAR